MSVKILASRWYLKRHVDQLKTYIANSATGTGFLRLLLVKQKDSQILNMHFPAV